MFRLSPLLLALVVGCTAEPGRGRPDTGLGIDASDPELDAASELDAAVPPDAGGPEPGWGLLSLNLHCLETDGTGFDDNGARITAIAEAVAVAGVRVLLLQEVCDDGSTDALRVLEGELETVTERPWHGAFAFAHVAWEGTSRQADEGVAILADVPIVDVQAFEHHAQGSLRRVTLSAALGDDLAGLRVASFHLDHADDAVRHVQARELATVALLYAGDADVIVGGDLNDVESSRAHAALAAAGYVDGSEGLRATRIDHVFVHRGASVAPLSSRLIFDQDRQRVSDHPGVLVRVDATTPTPVDLTTLEITVDVGFGNTLFVRGDQEPLSWDEGWPAINGGARLWRYATTELTGAFEYKVLRNDTDWAVGDNLSGIAGVTHEATVTAFE